VARSFSCWTRRSTTLRQLAGYRGWAGGAIFLADQAFAAFEHPAGLNQGDAGRVRLVHFPGRRCHPAASGAAMWRSSESPKRVARLSSSLLRSRKESAPEEGTLAFTPYGINNNGRVRRAG